MRRFRTRSSNGSIVPKKTAFVEFVLDQLERNHWCTRAGDVRRNRPVPARVFFGIIHRDVLYLKVNDDDACGIRTRRHEAVQTVCGPAHDVSVLRSPAGGARET